MRTRNPNYCPLVKHPATSGEASGESAGEPAADEAEAEELSDLTTIETTEGETEVEPQDAGEEPMEFVEPGTAETIEFSTLPELEDE